MALKFSSTKDAGKSVNVLIYGRAGVGKTKLIATAPNPIIISTESGLLSIADKNIPVIEVENLDDLNEAYDYISNKKAMKKGKFKTICLDSLSDIAESVLIDLQKNNKDGRRAYAELNSGICELIRKFRDVKMNTYFIAKSETYENASGLQAMRSSMPGKKLTNDLDYFFDEVLCLQINEDDEDKTYRYLQTQPTTTINAKDRSGRLDKVEEPNLTKLFKKLKG